MRVTAALVVCTCVSLPGVAGITVQPSRASFDPSLHQTVTYAISTDSQGALTATIVDRDLYATKTLANAQHVGPGTTTLTWDGTDANGRIVADEAWSLRVVLRTPSTTETYFPAAAPAPMLTIKPNGYDVQTGVLRYTLPIASRVHLEAGIADPSSSSPTAGAVMKTIVNREPRPAGAIVEQWMGMDESGTVYVPALKNFVVAIAATPLPDGAVITYGNRQRDFLHTALARKGEPLAKVAVHEHHQGLTVFDDIAPHLVATLSHARWMAGERAWRTSSQKLRVSIAPTGATADHFVRQPGRLFVYVDQKLVIDRKAGDRSLSIPVPHDNVSHVVAVNWVSVYGPVAATAFRVQSTD